MDSDSNLKTKQEEYCLQERLNQLHQASQICNHRLVSVDMLQVHLANQLSKQAVDFLVNQLLLPFLNSVLALSRIMRLDSLEVPPKHKA